MFKKSLSLSFKWLMTGLMFFLAAGFLPSVFGGESSRNDSKKGEKLFKSRCRACHAPVNPKKFSDDQWVDLVARYGEQAKLSAEEQKVLLEYLQSRN